MRYIAAPTLIRAKSFAHALGLKDSEWKALSTEQGTNGLVGESFVILPGTPADLNTAVQRCAAKNSVAVVDLTR